MTAESRHTFKARLQLGTTAWEAEDYGEALEIFQDLLVDEPTFADLHNKVGLCHAMMGQLEEALESFHRAGELAEGYAEAHLNRGIILNELGHHDEAAEAFETATLLDNRDGTIPSDVGNQIANAHAALGDLYQRARRPERAADQYRKALDVRPGYPDIRSKLADSLAEIGRPEEARVELEAALEAAPGLTGARVRLGVVLQQLGDTEGAIREWKRAHRDGSSDSRPRAYLARVGVEVEPRGGPPEIPE